jgi:hypothetical protein
VMVNQTLRAEIGNLLDLDQSGIRYTRNRQLACNGAMQRLSVLSVVKGWLPLSSRTMAANRGRAETYGPKTRMSNSVIGDPLSVLGRPRRE